MPSLCECSGHKVQFALPSGDHASAGQLTHALAPSSEYAPAGLFVHAVEPGIIENAPAEQFVHALVLSNSSPYVPAWHNTHSSPDKRYPRWHLQARASTMKFGLHCTNVPSTISPWTTFCTALSRPDMLTRCMAMACVDLSRDARSNISASWSASQSTHTRTFDTLFTSGKRGAIVSKCTRDASM
jgi:hypothetical protein